MQPDFATGLALYFVFIYSTVLHEAAHAFAAWKLGDDTAYLGGQVSLDPTPHIKREPFGMVLVPILSFGLNWLAGHTWLFGWASAPYNSEWAERYPRRSALMALAGPAANLLLVLVSALIIHVGYRAGWFAPWGLSFGCVVKSAGAGKLPEICALLLSLIFSLNLLLMAFNLLPLPPFDGSAVPLLFLKEDAAAAYRMMMASPWTQFMCLMVAFQSFGYIFGPVHAFAVRLLFPGTIYS